jgi:hypothetical protein
MSLALILFSNIVEGATDRLADRRYLDPKGYFKIVPPAGWRIQEYQQDPRGKVRFFGPEANVELGVLVEVVAVKTLDEAVALFREKERSLGISTNIRRITFLERPALERTFEWRGLKFYSVDFLVDGTAHNVAYNAPPHLWNNYRALVMKAMETYEPLLKQRSDAQGVAHAVAKAHRLAQLMVADGNLQVALEYVKEGLKLAPSHPGLRKLHAEIEEKLRRR